MAIPSSTVHLGIGGLTIVISIPLILRMIPMNHYYGIRMRKAFASDHNWYDINAFGGWLLLGYGLFLVIFGLMSRGSGLGDFWEGVVTVAPLLIVFPLLLIITAYSKKLPD